MNSMKVQDLLELYQLLSLYQQVYNADAEELLNNISQQYSNSTGQDISTASNPRKAGRKNTYDENFNSRILQLRQSGLTIRQVAAEAGCSIGHVQDVLNANK